MSYSWVNETRFVDKAACGNEVIEMIEAKGRVDRLAVLISTLEKAHVQSQQ